MPPPASSLGGTIVVAGGVAGTVVDGSGGGVVVTGVVSVTPGRADRILTINPAANRVAAKPVAIIATTLSRRARPVADGDRRTTGRRRDRARSLRADGPATGTVAAMNEWHVLVDRADYRHTELVDAVPVPLSDGDVRLAVDAFGLTANNVTYAAAGDMIGYWTFFPAPTTDDPTDWGRVPVWGFANVVESRHPGVEEGERWYGYLPMSTELVITATRVNAHGVTDGAEHRADLPPVYNQFSRCAADPGYDPDLEAEQMLYRPLFFTSFLIDDFLADHECFGASTVVLGSASSKTAFGVAHLLAARDVRVAGLTSAANVDFVTSLGCYDDVTAYDDVAALPDGPAVFVDMSGNPAVVRSVHERYGDDLAHSSAVGLTHWEDFGGDRTGALPGPRPEMFFAPARIEQRRADWGPGGVEQRLADVWPAFVDAVSHWVTIEHLTGPDAVRSTWETLVDGGGRPDRAHVLHPR